MRSERCTRKLRKPKKKKEKKKREIKRREMNIA